eukprot:COSAG05_NODE_591_length_8495_cov_3436.543116_8_plen_89_part_00
MDPMGDALKSDCEMNLGKAFCGTYTRAGWTEVDFAEVAGVPVNNMKKYWEEIAGSKQRWTQIQNEHMEIEVKLGISRQSRQSQDWGAT